MNRIKHRTTIALAGGRAVAPCRRVRPRGQRHGPCRAAAAAPTTTAAPATTPRRRPPPTAPVHDHRCRRRRRALGQGRRERRSARSCASADGLTLYGFTNDVDAISTCYSTCAEAWPPVIVDEEWAVGPGLDIGIFSTTEREDGTLQLVAGKFPLYTFGGDAAPGDITGQGSGEVWFAVTLDGTLSPAMRRRPAAEAPAEEAARRRRPLHRPHLSRWRRRTSERCSSMPMA